MLLDSFIKTVSSLVVGRETHPIKTRSKYCFAILAKASKSYKNTSLQQY